MASCYINLLHRADRRQSVKASLRAAGFAKPTRFEALREEEVPDSIVSRTWDTTLNARFDCNCRAERLDMSPGERGCVASHTALWRRCVESDAPLLVLEDDALLAPGSAAAVRTLTAGIERALAPRDRTVLLYLGAHVGSWRASDASSAPAMRCHEDGGSHRLREAEWIWQTHAYVVWPAAAAELLRALPADAPADVFLSERVQKRTLGAFVVEPPLAWQVDGVRTRAECSDGVTAGGHLSRRGRYIAVILPLHYRYITVILP